MEAGSTHSAQWSPLMQRFSSETEELANSLIIAAEIMCLLLQN